MSPCCLLGRVRLIRGVEPPWGCTTPGHWWWVLSWPQHGKVGQLSERVPSSQKKMLVLFPYRQPKNASMPERPSQGRRAAHSVCLTPEPIMD